jgi:hypothetical protein
MRERNFVGSDRHYNGKLGPKELQRQATASGGNVSAGSGPLVEGAGNAFLQGLDAVFLLVVDPGLLLDSCP